MLNINGRQFEIGNQKTDDDLIKEIKEVNEELVRLFHAF